MKNFPWYQAAQQHTQERRRLVLKICTRRSFFAPEIDIQLRSHPEKQFLSQAPVVCSGTSWGHLSAKTGWTTFGEDGMCGSGISLKLRARWESGCHNNFQLTVIYRAACESAIFVRVPGGIMTAFQQFSQRQIPEKMARRAQSGRGDWLERSSVTYSLDESSWGPSSRALSFATSGASLSTDCLCHSTPNNESAYTTRPTESQTAHLCGRRRL